MTAERSTLERVAASLEGLAGELRALACEVVEAGAVVHAAQFSDQWRARCDGNVYPSELLRLWSLDAVTCPACLRRGAQVREALQ